MMNIKQLFIIIAAMMCVLSCAQRGDEAVDPSQVTVNVSTSLNTKANINYPTAGADIDLSQLTTPVAGDFAVIISKDKEMVVGYPTFAQMPEPLALKVGKYHFKASYGQPSGCAWNEVYYEGEQDFALSVSQKEVSLGVQCDLKTAFAVVRFDDKFRNTFDDFSVSLSTEHTSQGLVFEDGQTRIGSFKPAKSLIIKVQVTLLSSGKQYIYGVDPIVDFRAGDLNVLNFTVDNGAMKFTLTADNGVRVVEKTVELDPNWLATRYTKMTTSYNPQEPISNIYGLPFERPLDVVITSNIGLKNLFLKFDDTFAAEMGMDSVDLLNMDEQQKALVDSRVGIEVTPLGMNYRVNMRRCINKMKLRTAATASYDLALRYVDMVDNTDSRALRLNIVPPEFTRGEQDPAKVWNRFAYVPHAEVTNVSQADKARFPMEYWIRPQGGQWRSLGVIAIAEDIYVAGLEPNTTYTTKVTFENMEMGESSFTTSGQTQIANGGFEDFTEWSYDGRGDRKGADLGGQWATLNNFTTMNRTNNMYFRSYPCVRVVGGRSGKAVEIATTGWGAGSTYKSEKKFLGSPWFHSQYCERATAGKVYLGTYSYDATSEEAGQRQGVALAGRPTALSFWYRYVVVNGTSMVAHIEILSGTEVVGTAEYTDNQTVGEFKNHIVPIKYSAQGFGKVATSIKLYFSAKSSAAAPADIVNINGSAQASATFGETIDAWDSRFEGSVLTVDDVTLIYPNDIKDFTIQ